MCKLIFQNSFLRNYKNKISIQTLIFLFVLEIGSCFGQVGGIATFEFLNLPTHARLVGLGGVNVSSSHKDVNVFMANPGLLVDSLDGLVGFNNYSYFAGVQNNQFVGAIGIGNTGPWGISLQQLNYGEFDSYNETGENIGTFTAKDFALVISHAHKINHFSIGMNIKFAQSTIDNYSASGILFDIGGAFLHPTKDLKVGLVFKNIGFPITDYIEGSSSFLMPFDAQIGFSIKPEKMPLRFSITTHHLHQFLNIAYEDPNQKNKQNGFGEDINQDVSFADKLSRHFVVGGEFVFSKNFNLRFGYNFLTRKELQVEQRKGMVGFSYGVMIRIKKFELAYSRAIQHLAGGSNNFTLIVNLKSVFKKKIVIE